jgi:hypothetical protein
MSAEDKAVKRALWASKFSLTSDEVLKENTPEPDPATIAGPDVAAITTFDARTEVSQDARFVAGRIVRHLWIIFVLLPCLAVLLFEILTSAK